MDDFSNRIAYSQASERVTKVLRSDANKERDKNGKEKKDKKDNKDKPVLEDELILHHTEETVDKDDEPKETEPDAPKEQPSKDESVDDEPDESSHIDFRA
jgi:hypothetical protein